MTNQQNEKSLMKYAVLVNAIQIVLCLLVYVLRLFDMINFTSVQVVIFFVELLIWFICSITFGLGMNIVKIRDAFTYSIITLLPIFLLCIISASLGFLTDGGGGWAGFFFIGSAVNFWMRPALALSHIINSSAYLLYGTHMLVLFVLSVVGVNFTISLNRSRNKKVKLTRTKKKTISENVNEEDGKKQPENSDMQSEEAQKTEEAQKNNSETTKDSKQENQEDEKGVE